MSQPIPLPPFQAFLASNIPSVYDNTLSYYDELVKLIAYLEQIVVPAINKNSQDIEAYVNGLEELKDYVDHYFDNLDVQDEIDNKLDEMAEGGQLASIIAEFLEMAPVFGYDTISAMSAATNLSDGSIARVLGNTSASDGDGAFYKVRTKEEGESADGVQKVAIGSTLIADRIVNATAVDLQNQIDDLKEPTKKYLFVGDSYAQGYTPDGGSTPWVSIVKSKLGLSSAQVVTAAAGGARFDTSNANNFYNLIDAQTSDNDITDIVIGGGYNDYGATSTNIALGIADVRTLCATKYPNAKLHIAFIGWTKNEAVKSVLPKTYQAYFEGCNAFPDIDFMKNTQYALHRYFAYFSSDGIHPNDDGQEAIAAAIVSCLNYGSANISYADPFYFTVGTGGALSSITMTTYLNNDTTTLFINGYFYINYGANSENWITLEGASDTQIGTITSGNIVGVTGDGVSVTTVAILQIDTASSTAPHDGQYVAIPVKVKISGGKIYLNAGCVTADGTSFGEYIVKRIQFSGFDITTNSMLA